jgi:hypothetical protein
MDRQDTPCQQEEGKAKPQGTPSPPHLQPKPQQTDTQPPRRTLPKTTPKPILSLDDNNNTTTNRTVTPIPAAVHKSIIPTPNPKFRFRRRQQQQQQ